MEADISLRVLRSALPPSIGTRLLQCVACLSCVSFRDYGSWVDYFVFGGSGGRALASGCKWPGSYLMNSMTDEGIDATVVSATCIYRANATQVTAAGEVPYHLNIISTNGSLLLPAHVCTSRSFWLIILAKI